MPANNSPRADWDEIAKRYQAGESARSLARAFGISHTAVNKRVSREGWQPGNPASWKRQVAQTETARRLHDPQTPGDRRALTLGNRSEANMRMMLAKVANGAKQSTAARSLGIKHPMLSKWKESDPVFAALLDAAEAEAHVDDEGAIVKARNRGDWKAALTRLERGKHTHDDWAAPEKAASSGGITVVFNWSRDDQPPMIDVTPDATPTATQDSDGQA